MLYVAIDDLLLKKKIYILERSLSQMSYGIFLSSSIPHNFFIYLNLWNIVAQQVFAYYSYIQRRNWHNIRYIGTTTVKIIYTNLEKCTYTLENNNRLRKTPRVKFYFQFKKNIKMYSIKQRWPNFNGSQMNIWTC